MSNILGNRGSMIQLGDQEVELDYPMGSIHFLAEKYGDITKLFDREGGAITKSYLEKIADVVYAGLMKFDDDGKDTSGWTQRKVLNKLRIPQIKAIVEAFGRSLSVAMPEGPAEGEADPTPAPAPEIQG